MFANFFRSMYSCVPAYNQTGAVTIYVWAALITIGTILMCVSLYRTDSKRPLNKWVVRGCMSTILCMLIGAGPAVSFLAYHGHLTGVVCSLAGILQIFAIVVVVFGAVGVTAALMQRRTQKGTALAKRALAEQVQRGLRREMADYTSTRPLES